MLALAATRAVRTSSVVRRSFCTPQAAATAVRATVLKLAEEKQAHSVDDLNADLSVKFELLTACECEFGMAMPHTALHGITTVEDAVHYWEGRLEEEADTRLGEEQHFTQDHPPNVQIAGPGRADVLRKWLREQRRGTGRPGAAAGATDDAAVVGN